MVLLPPVKFRTCLDLWGVQALPLHPSIVFLFRDRCWWWRRWGWLSAEWHSSFCASTFLRRLHWLAVTAAAAGARCWGWVHARAWARLGLQWAQQKVGEWSSAMLIRREWALSDVTCLKPFSLRLRNSNAEPGKKKKKTTQSPKTNVSKQIYLSTLSTNQWNAKYWCVWRKNIQVMAIFGGLCLNVNPYSVQLHDTGLQSVSSLKLFFSFSN